MKNINIENVFKITFVIIGTIIGAGFASGQEIYSFFNIYGYKGLIGIIVSIGLISLIIYKSLNIIKNNNIQNYQSFIKHIVLVKLKNNNLLIYSINNIINIFLVISFNVMVAGFSTYFFQELSIPKFYGAIIIAVLSYIIFINGIEGLMKINTCFIPIIILLICFLGINKIEKMYIILQTGDTNSFYWLLSSILYASYNSIPLFPILINFKDKINNRKEIVLITFIIFFLMLIMSIIIFLLINSHIQDVKDIEIPIVYIASTIGKGFKYLYGIVILIAIFTTAIGSGYGFLKNITFDKKKNRLIAGTMCLISVFVGQLGFSSLINFLYPVFGYLGLVQIFFLLI